MTELIEGVNPAFPAKGEKHDEIEVKIVEIKDADGTSIMDGAAEYDGRQFAVKGATTSTIKLDIKKYETIAVLEIEADPGSTVAKKYYGRPAAKTFVEPSKPGQRTLEWDGRADIYGERLLVEGEYKVTAMATCPCGNQYVDVKKIKVKKPYADAYGAKYPTAAEGDLSPIGAHVRGTALPKLSDGSGFECGGSATATASQALARMRHFSSVWFWVGHAGPGRVVFVDAAMKKSRLCSSAAAVQGFSGGFAAVDTLPAKSLDDVFLVVLLGCETAKGAAGVDSLPSALVAKGVDLVVAFPEKVDADAAPNWTRDFFAALDAGQGVDDAATEARSKALPASRASLKHRVVPGAGATKNDKLLPARNGLKKP